MNILRKLKDYRFEVFYALMTRRHEFLATHGTICPWTFDDRTLTTASRILSAGAGNDISFETALIERRCRVVLLDPSPTGIATVERAGLPAENLEFHSVGLAGRDGDLTFAIPSDEKEGSFHESTSGEQSVTFPCKRLGTLMKEFGWKHIDLLKMDIEGCEYQVLDDILSYRLDVRQICVEFHHGPTFGHTRMETMRAILRLRSSGYHLVHRVNWDHTFIRRPLQS